MRVVSVVGTRPQLIKAAALQAALRAHHTEILVDTGQHWDDDMAGSFVRELGLTPADHTLATGGGSHAEQTAAMLVGLEPILATERPDAVIVFGDTNSTLAGALVAAKLGMPVAHVEAGLRSFDRRMPEELNRLVADHLATWLFAPTNEAVVNLEREGIFEGVHLVGDLMQDLASRLLQEIRDPIGLAEIGRQIGVPSLEPGRYLMATVHRQENRSTDAIRGWTTLLRGVSSRERPVVLALHPGTRAVLERDAVDLGPHVRVVGPLGYRTALSLQLHAAAVLTDSGGVQREAAWLGVPCLVLRTTNEWQEVVDSSHGRVRLVGLDAAVAVRALGAIAPLASGPSLASVRARTAEIRAPGADVAIAAALSVALGRGGSG